jgi:hypothetical protein
VSRSTHAKRGQLRPLTSAGRRWISGEHLEATFRLSIGGGSKVRVRHESTSQIAFASDERPKQCDGEDGSAHWSVHSCPFSASG